MATCTVALIRGLLCSGTCNLLRCCWSLRWDRMGNILHREREPRRATDGLDVMWFNLPPLSPDIWDN